MEIFQSPSFDFKKNYLLILVKIGELDVFKIIFEDKKSGLKNINLFNHCLWIDLELIVIYGAAVVGASVTGAPVCPSIRFNWLATLVSRALRNCSSRRISASFVALANRAATFVSSRFSFSKIRTSPGWVALTFSMSVVIWASKSLAFCSSSSLVGRAAILK